MNKNVGKKIQTISTVFFILTLVFVWMVAIGIMLAGMSSSRTAGPMILVAFILGGIGSFFAWVSQLMLVAYGKIAEACEIKIGESQGVPNQAPAMSKPTADQVTAGKPVTGQLAQEPMQVPRPSAGFAPQAGIKSCPQCGNPVSPEGKFCPKCGLPFGAVHGARYDGYSS